MKELKKADWYEQWRVSCGKGHSHHSVPFRNEKRAKEALADSPNNEHDLPPIVQVRIVGRWESIIPRDAIPDGDRSGETYSHEFDYERLNAQAKRVYEVMEDGGWKTLRDISYITGDPEASVSSRLRDFRKLKFGGHILNTRQSADHNGLYFYQLIWNQSHTPPPRSRTK